MVVDYVPNAVPAASRDMIDLAEHSPSPAGARTISAPETGSHPLLVF